MNHRPTAANSTRIATLITTITVSERPMNLAPRALTTVSTDDDDDRQRFQQQRRRRGGHEGGGVTAEGRGVEGERDDVAGPHEQVQAAGEDAIAEALHQEMHGAAGGGECGAELGI